MDPSMAMADVSEFTWLKGPPMGSWKVAGSPEVWTSGKWISYEGAWKEGLQHGRGILTDKRGMVRVTRVDVPEATSQRVGDGVKRVPVPDFVIASDGRGNQLGP